MVGEVPLAPGAGHHDDAADVAQLRREPLGGQGFIRGLTSLPLFARAEDDRLVGLVRAGDVDLVHLRLAAEVGPLLGAAVDDAEETALDERLERLLQQRPQEDVDGVGLEHHHLVLHEELVEGVHGADRGDVARPQHQRDLPLADRRVECHGLGCGEALLRHARLHPDVGGDAGVEDAVVEVEGEDAGEHLAVRTGAHGPRDAGPAVGLDVQQRLAQQAQVAQDEVGPHQGLLAGDGVVRVEPLGLDPQGGPAVRHGGEAAGELGEQRQPLSGGDGRPGALLLLQGGHGRVHLRAGRGAGGAGDDLGGEGGGHRGSFGGASGAQGINIARADSSPARARNGFSLFDTSKPRRRRAVMMRKTTN